MFNFGKYQPHHHDPGKDGVMDVDVNTGSQIESNSPLLNSQEGVMLLAHDVRPEFTEYTTVSRSRERYFLKFPVAYFDEKPTLKFLSGWATAVLARHAPVKPNTFFIESLPNEDGTLAEYLIFQVSSATHLAIACKQGAKAKDDEAEPVLFKPYTAEAQAYQQGRVIELSSLAFNVTQDNLFAAMSEHGQVQSIRTNFNAKLTMMNATVVFKSAECVQQLHDKGTTCLPVIYDVATVTKLGNNAIQYNSTLTLKLAHLPRGTRPIDLWHVFANKTKQDLENNVTPAFSYHSITMPVSITTKQRLPEAYIHFSSTEQQQAACKTLFKIDDQATVWVTPDQHTCFFCGQPGHFQRECDRFQSMLNHKAARRANAAIIKGASSSSRSLPKAPLTQVPKSNVTQPTPPKQPTSSRPATLSSQGRSYAATVMSSTKNKGAVASNPISISSTASSASVTSPKTIAAAPAKAVTTANTPTTDWKVRFNELSARMTAMSGRLDIEIQNINRRMTNIDHQLGLILNALTTSSTTTSINPIAATAPPPSIQHPVQPVSLIGTSAGDEDIDLPQANNIVPSTPPPITPPTLQEQLLSTETPLIRRHNAGPSKATAPYSINATRTHLTGGTSLSKNDPERGNSSNSINDDLAHKGKAVQKESVNLQEQCVRLQQMNAALMADMERRDTAFARLEEQFHELLNKEQSRGDGVGASYSADGRRYASSYWFDPNEYRGVSEIGSAEPTDTADNNAADPDTDEEI